MDNSAFGIPEQLLTTLRILNSQSQMDTYSKQTRGFLEISLEKPTSTSTHSDPKPRPIIANVVDRGDREGAKLHFAKRQIRLTEKNENESQVLAARTTARRKGNPNMGKRILKAKSPGKKLRDQRRLSQFSKPKEDYR